MKTKILTVKILTAVGACGFALGAMAQTNLVLNGDFSSGSASWNNNLNGAYFYYENTVSANIVSMGWTDGLGIWQNTTSAIQAGDSYASSVTAQVGQSPMTGLNISLQDVSTGWSVLANQTFTFSSQSAGPSQWETFTLDIPASTLSSLGGDILGVGITLNESPNTQYGWVWAKSVSLVAVPEPSTLVLMSMAALGGFTVLRRRK